MPYPRKVLSRGREGEKDKGKSCCKIAVQSMVILNYSWAAYPLHRKYGKEPWLDELLGYLIDRYTPLEERLLETFRYVACDSANLSTHSYEFASIIRDAGSVFGSTMDELLDNTGAKPVNGQQFSIKDYKPWLVQNVSNISQLSIELAIQRENRYLMPFSSLKNPSDKLNWWDAQNNLKHSDFKHFAKGHLQNAMNGTASIAALYILMTEGNPIGQVNLFYNLGYRQPQHQLEKNLFCAS